MVFSVFLLVKKVQSFHKLRFVYHNMKTLYFESPQWEKVLESSELGLKYLCKKTAKLPCCSLKKLIQHYISLLNKYTVSENKKIKVNSKKYNCKKNIKLGKHFKMFSEILLVNLSRTQSYLCVIFIFIGGVWSFFSQIFIHVHKFKNN